MPPPRPVTRPIAVELPAHGVFFAESVHDASFQMPWRRDPFHKVLHVVRGRSVAGERASAREAVLAPGDVFVVPAGVEHRLHDLEPSVLRLLCVAPGMVAAEPGLADAWQRLGAFRTSRLPPAGGLLLQLESLWHGALLEQVNQALGHSAILRSLASQWLVHLARRPEAVTGDAAGRVDGVVRELAASFFDEWTLDRAAAAAGMSRRSFSAHFHLRTGRTFVAHLTSLRLEHAARLLAQGNHSIIGAALASGYRDVSHFHRRWRRHYGTTPKAWAERTTGGRVAGGPVITIAPGKAGSAD